MTTSYPETNAEVIEKALYCLKHGEMESVENWLGLLLERLTTDNSRADALTFDQAVQELTKFYGRGGRATAAMFAPVEQHEAAPADLIAKAGLLAAAVIEYPDFDFDNPDEPRPLCKIAKDVLAAIEQNAAPLEGTGNGADVHATALRIVHEESERTLSQKDFDMCMRMVKAALSRAPRTEMAGAVPAGWRLVPVDPTVEMLTFVYDPGADDSPSERYAALLAAAPLPPSADAAAAPADERAAFGYAVPVELEHMEKGYRNSMVICRSKEGAYSVPIFRTSEAARAAASQPAAAAGQEVAKEGNQ
ncbi:hypothetical protein [Burkholderia cenocepacia]|uniref:hypothetical protein n=1 Tax=Burkholderia cenocepacia TaxID=95486 RepID=UPI001B96F1EF|nr:hypothetical protein [Burkholderia cenocepacia]MBR8409790.1 hypothetical protein [Burkholderia cenocepacia]